jgi:hypothetical protein
VKSTYSPQRPAFSESTVTLDYPGIKPGIKKDHCWIITHILFIFFLTFYPRFDSKARFLRKGNNRPALAMEMVCKRVGFLVLIKTILEKRSET